MQAACSVQRGNRCTTWIASPDTCTLFWQCHDGLPAKKDGRLAMG